MDTTGIARELIAALDRGATLPSVAGRNPGFGWDEGYAVAAEILKLRRARGERPVGRKIGFTNRNIWAEYGATAPIWAHVYDRTLIHANPDRATVSLNVPYLIHRVRSQNISDKLETEHTGEFTNGDAAFADYVILLGFSRRF